ncbi:Rieske (2Fe-2S) protein [Geothrix paludis]|uniref:Rieske (2Fe-2S) protein n=1 Tax=Geothrix paludis TaxID=2922722 RepID=UPI001FAD2C9A|nr:Rieske (2Fe-2S) protein [Geothrix paludis]
MSRPEPSIPAATPSPSSGLDRREFCACALAVAAAAAVVSCGGGGGGGSASAPPPPPPPPPPSTVTTSETKASMLAQPSGTVKDYTTTASGSCPLVFGAAQGYYLVRDSAGIYAFNASCLHQGGRLGPTQTGFSCPCHGSQYDLNGTVTQGPAPVGSTLQHYEVSEATPGGALVIDPSKPVSAATRLT